MYPYFNFPLAESLNHLRASNSSKQGEICIEEKLEWKEKAVLTNCN